MTFSGDNTLLRQMVGNLLDNAIRHAKSGGHVAATVRRTPTEVTIRVTDDGDGIPPHEQERIFQRFVRLDARSTGRRSRPADRPLDCRGARRPADARIQRRIRQPASASLPADCLTRCHRPVIWTLRSSDAANCSRAVSRYSCRLRRSALRPRRPAASLRRRRPRAGSRHGRRRDPRPAPIRGSGSTAPRRCRRTSSLDDGLTSEEAVSIALWNSPSFQATLADLGIARADLVEAGLLRNPVFSLLFPVGAQAARMDAAVPVRRDLAAAQARGGGATERAGRRRAAGVGRARRWSPRRARHMPTRVIAERRLQLTIENAELVQRLADDHRGAPARRRHQRARGEGGAQRRRARARSCVEPSSTIATSPG